MITILNRMWRHLPSQLAAAVLGLLLSAAACYGQSAPPTLPDHTVYGRLGSGTGSGPGQAIPFATLAAQLWSNPVTVATIFGGSSTNSSLNLYGTSNGSPSGDNVNNFGTSWFFYEDHVAGNGNSAYYSYGVGPNGEGITLGMNYRNLDNTGPISGQELGGWAQYVWDSTQYAPTSTPIEILAVAAQQWTATHHGANIVFQAIPNNTAQGVNEFAVGNGVSALASGDPASTQGAGQGTFNARNALGYYIGGANVLNVTGNYTTMLPPATQNGARVLVGNSNDAEVYLSGSAINIQNQSDVTSIQLSANEIEPTDITVALGDATHRFTDIYQTGKASFGGQIIPAYGTPTIASGACGATTNGAIAAGGTNQSGEVTIGSASTTTCTIGFSTTLVAAPLACVLFPANAAAAATGTTIAYVSAITTGHFVITGSALANANYYYHCM